MMSAEEKLWLGVIVQTIQDIENTIHHIKYCLDQNKHEDWFFTSAFFIKKKNDLLTIFHEVNSAWFFDVCQNAGIHPRKVNEKIEKLFKKYDLDSTLIR